MAIFQIKVDYLSRNKNKKNNKKNKGQTGKNLSYISRGQAGSGQLKKSLEYIARENEYSDRDDLLHYEETNVPKEFEDGKDFVDTIPSYMRDDYIRMTKEGHLDPQNVWLLQGLERGKAGVASGALGMVGQAAGYISEATETINRRATMYAALEISHKLGAAKLKAKGFDSAYDFAVTTIQQTFTAT